MRTPDGVATLSAVVAGQGIEGAAASPLTTALGELRWERVRDETDKLGMRHVFYRQVLGPSPILASVLCAERRNENIPIVGGEIGVHWVDGAIRTVFGYQHRAIGVKALPAVGCPGDAYLLVQRALALRTDFADGATQVVLAADRIADAPLRLERDAPSDGLRFVWEFPVWNPQGSPYAAFLDAATGDLLRLEQRSLSAVCSYSSTTKSAAVGLPENGGTIPSRSITATAASDRQPTFTHEGYWPAPGTGVPDIELYLGIRFDDPGYSQYHCPDWPGLGDDAWFGTLPVKSPGGTPTYDDWTEVAAIPGKAAGDSMWFTYLTMSTLRNRFGRWSYDGNGSTARVVVNHRVGYDNGEFCLSESLYAPAMSVGVYRNSTLPVHCSACIDFVGHEWGHGVVATSAGWPYYADTEEAQLHEGFADAIGYAVELYNQPAGSGVEKAEWQMMEDCGGPKRRADEDDGAGGYTFHRDDDPDTTEQHARGNMLAVAFRLMSEGGSNPVCARLSNLSGCNISVGGLGYDKAARILVRTLTAYCTSSTGWADLADVAKEAAFDLYSVCHRPYSATEEQQAANDAFTAIGYPGDVVYRECP